MLRTLRYLSLMAISVAFTSVPAAEAAPPEPHYDAVITVSSDYVVRYNGRQMPDVEALMREIGADASNQPNMTVMVKAPETLDQSYTMMIMQIVDQSGAFSELDTEENFRDGNL